MAQQLHHPSQVLSSSCEQELISGTIHSTQSQAIQFQDALEVGKQHLDLFPVIA